MNWIKNTILLLVSLTFCYGLLVVGDIFLEENAFKKFRSINKDIKKIKKFRADRDKKTLNKLKNDGYSPVVYPSLWDDNYRQNQINYKDATYPPLIAGKPYTKTFYCNEGDGFKKYVSDRFGFRNDDKSWNQKINTIFIGDSFTQGGCVDDLDTISNKYEKLSKKNSINLGFSGNNPSHYLTYSKLFIPKIKPDEVFLVYYANDFRKYFKSVIEDVYVDNGVEFFSKNKLSMINEKKYFKVAEQIMIKEKERINKTKTAKKSVEKKFKKNFLDIFIYELINHSELPFIRSLIMRSKIQFKTVKISVLETIKLCETFSCKLHIVYIPNSEFWAPEMFANRNADKLKRISNKNNILFFDGREVINRKKDSDDYASEGPHMSKLGYFKIAELIYNNK